MSETNKEGPFNEDAAYDEIERLRAIVTADGLNPDAPIPPGLALENERLRRELEEARERERAWREAATALYLLIDHLDECGDCYAKPCDEWSDMMVASEPLAKRLAGIIAATPPEEASDA